MNHDRTLLEKPNLPEQIRNLPCKVPDGYPFGSELCAGVYRQGHRDARHAAAELAAAALSAAPAQEPVMWQYRWTNPAGDIVPPSMLEWKEVQPWTAIQSLEQRIEELRSLCYQGKHAYEVRALSASPLPQEPQEGKALTDSDQMRAEFMAWAQDRGCDTDGAWSAWQACWNLRGAQEGKAGEWRTVERDGMPPCDGETVFVGINSAGFACCFNEVTKDGVCSMQGPELSTVQMSALRYWRVLDRPSATLAASREGEQR